MRKVDVLLRVNPGENPIVLGVVIDRKLFRLRDLDHVREMTAPDGRSGLCYSGRIGSETRRIFLIGNEFWLEDRDEGIKNVSGGKHD